ncbi:Eukaryotic translation initiation factor 3 subunit H [Diplonema papillatum]|nr:Eukaryotic translation initiation factor 3 subunit H [Diplonema papillatum]
MHVYQQDLGEHSVCLLIDPVKSLHGKLFLKAMRLKPEFMKMFTENKDKKDFSQNVVNNYQVTSADVFQEVPITISNCHLIDQYLWELGSSPTYAIGTTEENIIAAEQVLTPYQTLSATAMVEQTEAILGELNKYQTLSRARNKDDPRDKDAKPSRLDTLTLTAQLNTLSRHMCDVSHIAFESISLCEALQQAQQASSNI